MFYVTRGICFFLVNAINIVNKMMEKYPLDQFEKSIFYAKIKCIQTNNIINLVERKRRNTKSL